MQVYAVVSGIQYILVDWYAYHQSISHIFCDNLTVEHRPTDPVPSSGRLHLPELSNRMLHYDIKWRDFITMVAAVNGTEAYQNQMIPMFAQELKDPTNKGDIYEIFLKTHHRLKTQVPGQIPEFRSTLSLKLSLRNIFKPWCAHLFNIMFVEYAQRTHDFATHRSMVPHWAYTRELR